MYDKTYLFKQHTIHLNALVPIPLMEKKGILST